MSADDVPGLADPLVLQDRLYLRCAGGTRVVRPPAAPALLGAPGLALYRHDDGEPRGGGVLTLTLDLGAPSDPGDAADAALPAQIQEVLAPQHADGEVRLVLGEPLASAPVAAGVRPVVALAAGLDITRATLLRSLVGPGTPPGLGATATGTLVVSGGPRGRVEIDRDGARAELAGAAGLTDGDVADALDRLLKLGLVRVTLAESFAAYPGWPPLAFAAAALFEPAVTAHPWTAVPGLRLPGYAPDARWQPASGRPGGGPMVLTLDGNRLPWAAAAPLPLDQVAVTEWDLPGSRVRQVDVMVLGPWPADVADPAVQVRIGDGPATTVPLTAERQSVRLVPPAGGPGDHSWRVTARRGDHAVAGAWETTRSRELVVRADQQMLDDNR
ncbi:MAG TPA: hypothetical protein VGP36_23825 [Mycobacteriales bacterium]|jgi:hypothetical protein|nr:hypothetical protein [Mycobacteriales bacterium]